MQTIPAAIIDKIVAHRPHLAALVRTITARPMYARRIERDLAIAYLAGETRLTAQETNHLAGVASGKPWPTEGGVG